MVPTRALYLGEKSNDIPDKISNYLQFNGLKRPTNEFSNYSYVIKLYVIKTP